MAAVQAGLTLNMVQKRCGHTQHSTTATYAVAAVAEAVAIAKRTWDMNRTGRE